MRYAVYYTPRADHPLSAAVATWLGRDAFQNVDVETTHGLEAHITSPRRYGFHGTLKAPFHLADSASEDDLVELFETYAAEHETFELPELTLGRLGPFFALVPSEPSDPLQQLGEGAVRTFEPLRAPLSEADIARRNPDALSENQRAHLMRWGYPYVMDEFRFHLTLTDKIADEHVEGVEQAIRHHFADFIGKPLTIDTLGLFAEPARGEPFFVMRTASLS